jgi:TetR/AcrR family transcriptional repressor of nem operon
LRADTDIDALSTTLLTTVQGGILLTKTLRDTSALRTALDAVFDYIETFTAAD